MSYVINVYDGLTREYFGQFCGNDMRVYNSIIDRLLPDWNKQIIHVVVDVVIQDRAIVAVVAA